MLLPLAIFMLVVLAAMTAYAMRMLVLATASGSLDIFAAGAYQAAVAGTQWMQYRVLQPDRVPLQLALCPAAATLPINGFSVDVRCTQSRYVDNGNQEVAIYEIAAIAHKGDVYAPDYVEREVRVTLSRCLLTTTPAMECS
jgi:asparagine N-glycosylation enzyme membrane subunit Stt3